MAGLVMKPVPKPPQTPAPDPARETDELPILEGPMLGKVKGGWASMWVKTQGGKVIDKEVLDEQPRSRVVALETLKIAFVRRLVLQGREGM